MADRGSALLARLQQLPHPVSPADAQGVEQVTDDLHEALHLLGRDSTGQLTSQLSHWREYFGVPEQRLYYVNEEISYNSWDAPPCFKFREWALDSQLYGISLRLARDVYQTLDAFLTRHAPEVVFKALAVLAKLVGNVADCGNTIERFRSVKTDNPKFQAAVWDVAGASQILFLVGWRQHGSTLSLAADAPLGPVQAAASRLRRLADKKGHSGEAVAVKPAGEDGSRPPSPYYGTPGFRYQEQIFHCSACDRPINDGSERLWTGRHDSPPGEYRYECSTCRETGTTFNLCQGCWDVFQTQQAQAQQGSGGGAQAQQGSRDGTGSSHFLHDRTHAFQHIGPRMSRHNDYYGNASSSSDPSNPWGNRPRGAGYGRALQRLSERYGGMRFA
ncbi:UBA UBX kDa [Chlorella sorokiniana]|uniref:UBA UBX kDa n=1 Tax=Chlorella sorokiniana TaxID=3076 RepID=A0A2P6TUM7_CHLSO|nr:UBA UBX kDa [Chlorella sorokiniana]|eukprot:PRW57772.1 UBA UBX kDa [Chlorella sorokiniana]